MLKGIDIAYPYQPDPLAMRKVKAEGADFVVQKVSQGVYFDYNPKAGERIERIRKAGLVAGAYHFLTRVEDATGQPFEWNSGTAQCNAFVAALPDGSPEGLICMVDWENNPGQAFTFAGAEHEPQRRGGSWLELRDFVLRWFALFPAHPLFVYTRKSYAVARSEGNDVQALNPRLHLWDANWVSQGTPAFGRDIDQEQIRAFAAELGDVGRRPWRHGYAGFEQPTVWQFGGFGIKDYNGGRKVDGNLFRGSRDQLESYARSEGALTVSPLPVGTVGSLVDERLKAALSAPTGSAPVSGYEIQLEPRRPTGTPDWDDPTWVGRGVPAEPEPIDDDDDRSEPPSASALQPPHFETLDGCPAVTGMLVDANLPTARLSTDEPVEMYRWRLRQDDDIIDSGSDDLDPDGDGRCFTFTPSVKLRRGRPDRRSELGEGEFLLPFEKGITYNTRTYAGHSNFAVDFNRDDRQDRGEWVYAPAPGRVQHVIKGSRTDPVNGPPSELYIGHRGRFQTVYAHMKNIQVRKGDRVQAGQRLGQVSDVGSPGGPHLHLQIRRRSSSSGSVFGGTPVKMRLEGKPMQASIGDSDTRGSDWPVQFGQKVTGKAPPQKQVRPELRVAVRRDGEWSANRRLEFLVSKRGNSVPDCVDPGCQGHERPGGVAIEHLYDGPALEPGNYSLRYRITDDLGNESDWAFDHSVVVTGDDEDA